MMMSGKDFLKFEKPRFELAVEGVFRH